MRGIRANGKTIRAIRDACAMTQEDLAALAGCDVKTVRSAERGRSVDVKTLRAVATALDVPVAAIARDADPEPEQIACRVNTVQAWQLALNRREISAMLRAYHADAEILFPRLESLDGKTAHRGTVAIRQLFKAALARVELKAATPKSFRLHVSGDYAFFRGRVTGRLRTAQRSFTVDVFHEFRFRGSGIANHVVLFDTAALSEGRTK